MEFENRLIFYIGAKSRQLVIGHLSLAIGQGAVGGVRKSVGVDQRRFVHVPNGQSRPHAAINPMKIRSYVRVICRRRYLILRVSQFQAVWKMRAVIAN